MKIFLTDNNKVNIYSLPQKAEDEFLINYKTNEGIEETITITAENNQWNIISNHDVAFYEDSIEVMKEPLSDGKKYQVKFNDLDDPVFLYCYDTPIEFYNFAIDNKAQITLGRTSNCDIIYEDPMTLEPHLKIFNYNNLWYIEDPTKGMSNIYVNNKKITTEVLNTGDVIFVNGLKIIWMKNFISMNNPNGKLSTLLAPYKDYILESANEYTEVKESEKNKSLYSDNQVFFHKPRLKEDIVPKTIKIDNPPEPIKKDETPAILTYGATIMMGLSSSITGVIAIFNIAKGKATILSSITEISLCIAMLSGCILFPILLDKYQKKKAAKEEEKRQKKYTEYLNKKTAEINVEMEKQKQLLFKNNPDVEECKSIITKALGEIWKREILDNDFLSIRLGLGNKAPEITIEATQEEFSLTDDNLKERVKEIKDTSLVLEQVPITISLIENDVLPIVVNESCQYRRQCINWLMLQLITYYSGMDLKIAILTSKSKEHEWEYFKYLSHNYIHDQKIRLFATTEEEIKATTSYLETVYQERYKMANDADAEEIKNAENITNKEKYKIFDSYYLIITDNYINVKKYDIIKNIINNNTNLGFSLVTIEDSMSTIPSRFDRFIEITNNHSKIYSKVDTTERQLEYTTEYLPENISYYARIIANIPTISSSVATSLPSSINFLEMYKVGKIEQLNIVNRWQNNNPVLSLSTPLGVRDNGKFLELDLHEKYHGPHGLIAGSTGSGKSEFIITFILSMAINYHPHEVQFVLIDYKGGGLAGAFENKEKGIKIPHLVGTITNLDTNEMNRTLVSINSELKRREKMFNKARDLVGESTIDIYKYQKYYREGKLEEPIAHLFIISDEFAELKAQQPDFMDELVSAARIGRSLGVHLILATQKPSGVVDDQIWSNSRFKICLKVQTTEDSNELLKRPEAASIKETGRFYLQVGHNELFEQGQAAWAGAKYIPTERIQKPIDDSIEIIDRGGNVVKKITDKIISSNYEDVGDQLTNIVKYLYNIAIREKIKFNSLWLPSIPEEIFLSNIIQKYNYKAKPYEIVPIIGEYDNPSNQTQGILTVDLTNTGNLIIYGNAGSGKENLLSTLIYSTIIYHSSEEVNFYIYDFGAETLKVFRDVPQVGDVSLITDKIKIKSALLWIERELARRKDLFVEYGGTYATYINSDQPKIPLIVNVINAYEAFVENYSSFADFLQPLLRDCAKYGIIFIVTANNTNFAGSSFKQNFTNKLAMQLADAYDYKYEFNAPFGLTPAKCFGRGIIDLDGTGYEFQTTYIYKKNEINETIKKTAMKLKEVYKPAKKIPIIPEKVTADTVSPYIDNLGNVPIGLKIFDAEIATYNFNNRITPIIGNELLNNERFIIDLIEVVQSVPKVEIKIIDFIEKGLETNNIEYITGEYTAAINNIEKNNKQTNKIIYIILGIGRLYDYVLDEGIAKLFNIFENIDKLNNISFILLDNLASFKKVAKENWYTKITNGIWMGKEVDIQNVIKLKNLSSNDANEAYRGLAYLVENGEYKVIKTVGVTGDDDY